MSYQDQITPICMFRISFVEALTILNSLFVCLSCLKGDVA